MGTMTKILLINASCCAPNKGAAAMAISSFRSLKEFIPDVDFIILSGALPDLERCVHNIKHINKRMHPIKSFSLLFRCALWSILHNYFGLSADALIKNEKILQAYVKTDIVIDLRGDTFSDDYGVSSTIFSCRDMLFGIFLGKPVVIYPQSIGPFKTKLTKYLARFTLNRVSLIMVREDITRNYLQTMGINKPPIYLIPDISFLLQPASDERIQEILSEENINRNNSPIIGLSVSQQISHFAKADYEAYVNLMIYVVDYLTEKLNATVVFVPHVVASWGDDRIIAEKIYQKVKDKRKVISISNEYTPEELRGIIGQFDLFIGSRMHANISATSMCVPTVAIAYSHKTHGIMKMLGQEKYVCDIETIISNKNELTSKINSAWENRAEIKKELEMKIKLVRERTLLSAKLVKELLDSSKLS